MSSLSFGFVSKKSKQIDPVLSKQQHLTERRAQMEYTHKIYVEFLYPGVPFGKSTPQETKNRNPSEVKIPNSRTYGFRFFDVFYFEDTIEGKSVKFTSERVNISPKYFPEAKLYTAKELKDGPFGHILSNNQISDCELVVRCRTGDFFEFRNGDFLV